MFFHLQFFAGADAGAFNLNFAGTPSPGSFLAASPDLIGACLPSKPFYLGRGLINMVEMAPETAKGCEEKREGR